MRNSTCQCPRMGNLVQHMNVGPPSPHILQSQSPHACCSQPMVGLFILLYIELLRSVFPVSWFPALQANCCRPVPAPAKAVSKHSSLSSRPTAPPAFLCCQLQVSSSHSQLSSLVNQVSFVPVCVFPWARWLQSHELVLRSEHHRGAIKIGNKVGITNIL